MRSKAGKMFGLILLASAGAAFSVTAAEGLQSDNVAQRQQGMKAMAAAANIINAVFTGSSAYDAKALKTAAETIESHSAERLSFLFDGSVTAPGSKASASIEAERERFDKLAADLGVYASALSTAADRNPDAPQMRMQGGGDLMMGGPLARKADAVRDVASMPAEHAFHLMLQTCTSCHAKFRTKDE